MKTWITAAVLLGLSSCSSPPKPPTVDEARRHPVNAVAEVDLQGCKSELQKTRILASESTRDATGLKARLAALNRIRSSPTAIDDSRSSMFTVLFPFGATSVELPRPALEALVARAQSAPLIVLSGRTDGTANGAAEAVVARGRAEYLRDILLRAGVPAARIRTTWQPVGDHAADNGSALGRSLNRRVEIEIYRAAPKVAGSDWAAA